MELLVFSTDLKPDKVDLHCLAVKYEDFNKNTQSAIKIVGKATFHSGGRYNTIRPPKE
jgi:hypothetical protein